MTDDDAIGLLGLVVPQAPSLVAEHADDSATAQAVLGALERPVSPRDHVTEAVVAVLLEDATAGAEC